jgi:hypothetical protein
MKNNNCVICGQNFQNVQDSNEHIIPNAIGGRKKIKQFICVNCNNKTGREWDAELAKQLEPMSLYLRIKRERGEIKPQIFSTSNGQTIRLKNDGTMEHPKPLIQEKYYEETKSGTIHASVRSKREAKQLIDGYKRKGYKIQNEEGILNSLETKRSYLNEFVNLNISIDGDKAGRSIVKSLVAFAVCNNVNLDNCTLAIKYLREKDAEACFRYFNDRDFIKNRENGMPIHCVALRGIKEQSLLVGYIEFFGIWRIVSCLSDSYNGEDFFSSYAINPVNGEEVKIDIDLNILHSEIRDSYDYKMFSTETLKDDMSNIISITQAHYAKQEQDRVFSNAVDKAFKSCGAEYGEILTKEHIDKINSIIWKEIEPYMISLITKKRG